jgi:beta-barrel assembly-enhancing protease
MRCHLAIAACLLTAATLGAGDKKSDPSQIGNRDVGKGVNLYSIENEIALGKQLAEEVQREARMVQDPLIAEYINRIGQNLARNSDAKVPFTFRVLDDESLNAFALPGGFVFINSGLIKVAEDEDELAGALAHEIAHVAARHMTRQASKSRIADILMLPAEILFGGWTGYAVRQGANVGIPATFLSFGRKDESEADYLGVQYMYAAGYDPSGVISIFEKLELLNRKQPGAIGKIFASHPPDADRIRQTQREIDEILPSRPEYVVTTSEYRNMRERLIGLSERKGEEQDRRPRLRAAPGQRPDSEDEGKPTIRRRDIRD